MRIKPCLTALSLLAIMIAPSLGRAEPSGVAGIPSELVGPHGPTVDWTSELEVVAHSSLMRSAPTPRALGNNGGLALIGDCAYVGRWHDYSAKWGVQVVDLASSTTSELPILHDVPETSDSKTNVGVPREIRALDIPGYRLLVVMTFGQGIGDRVNNKLLFFRVSDTNCSETTLVGTFDMRALRGHEFFLWVDPDPAHDVDGKPRVLLFVTTPPGPPAFIVVDATDPAAPSLVGTYDAGMPVVSATEVAGSGLGKYGHSIAVSPDGKEAHLSYWDGGYFTVDTSAFAFGAPAGTAVPKGAMSVPYTYPLGELGNTHSAVKVPGTNTMVVGDEIYVSTDGCPFGWMRTIDNGSATEPPRQVGEFRLPENDPARCGAPVGDAPFQTNLVVEPDGRVIDGTFSMHNQTVAGRFVFTTWYGGGLRVVDVGDPTAPAEVGAFVPAPLAGPFATPVPDTSAPTYGATPTTADDWWVQMWSYPILRDGKIYVTDTRNGLYVLRPAPGSAFEAVVAATPFLEGNSNLGEWRAARGV